jgi:hypothetical protein
MFAIKVTEREREAMDMTSEVFGQNLARLYYPALRDEIHRRLGTVILDRLNKRKISAKNESVPAMLEAGGPREMPALVRDFIGLLGEPNKKAELGAMFRGVRIADKGYLLNEMELEGIVETLGREYLEGDGPIPDIDLALVYELFFGQMLRSYYCLTAEGSMEALNEVWDRNAPRLQDFKRRLIQDYNSKYAEHFYEVVEVEAIADEDDGAEEREEPEEDRM